MEMEIADLRRKLEGHERGRNGSEPPPTGKMDVTGVNGETVRIQKADSVDYKAHGAASVMAFRMLGPWRGTTLKVAADVRESDGVVWSSGTVLPNDQILHANMVRRSIVDQEAGLEAVERLRVMTDRELFKTFTGQNPKALETVEVSFDAACLADSGHLASMNDIKSVLDNCELLWCRIFGLHYKEFLNPVREIVLKTGRRFTIEFRVVWLQVFIYSFLAAMSQRVVSEDGEAISLVRMQSQEALRDKLIKAEWTQEYARDMVESVAKLMGLTEKGQLAAGKKMSLLKEAPASPAKGTRQTTAAVTAAAAAAAGSTSVTSLSDGGEKQKAVPVTDFCVFELADRLGWANSYRRKFTCTAGDDCKRSHGFPTKAVTLARLEIVIAESGFRASVADRKSLAEAITAKTPWFPKRK